MFWERKQIDKRPELFREGLEVAKGLISTARNPVAVNRQSATITWQGFMDAHVPNTIIELHLTDLNSWI